MGFSGISIWQLLIVLAIIVLLFGTKKLRGIGTDIGGAVKGFRGAMKDAENGMADDDKKDPAKLAQNDQQGRVIDTEVTNAEASTKDEKKV